MARPFLWVTAILCHWSKAAADCRFAVRQCKFWPMRYSLIVPIPVQLASGVMLR